MSDNITTLDSILKGETQPEEEEKETVTLPMCQIIYYDFKVK